VIVISDDVVLSAEAIQSGITANNPRIGYHNLVTEANVFADLEDPDFPAVNMANPATYIKWKGEETTSEQSVGIVLSPAQTVNYFAIARHNLGTISSEYVFSYSTNGGGTWTPLTTPRIPADDYVIMHEFSDTFATHFKLEMTSSGDAPEIAVLHIGRITRLQRRIFVGHTPIVFGRDTTVSTGVSEEGEFLGRVVRRRMYKSAVSMNNITGSYYRTVIDPFFHAAASQCFFWAWRPSSYPLEVGYAWLDGGDGKMQNSRANGMIQIDFQMEGIR
jgi:hypothetical protein